MRVFLGSKRIEQMRRWAVQKTQDTALKAADPKKGRTLSKARGIGAEIRDRRADGAGQSGSFASDKGAGGCELQRKARCAPLAARTRPKKRGALAGA